MKGITRVVFVASLVLALCGFVLAQRKKSVLLPSSEAKTLANQCSRPSPPGFTETWEPTGADIKRMESRLSQIADLRAKCCMEGAQIENPSHFYMQYVGIVVKCKRLIYINAFADDKPPEFWRERAVMVCDGGTDWGVLYDPEKGKFFDLAVNGVG